MGKGYWILVWDEFGAGLVMLNPRMHTEGVDMYGNPCNWWPCDDGTTEEQIAEKHDLNMKYNHYRIVF